MIPKISSINPVGINFSGKTTKSRQITRGNVQYTVITPVNTAYENEKARIKSVNELIQGYKSIANSLGFICQITKVDFNMEKNHFEYYQETAKEFNIDKQSRKTKVLFSQKDGTNSAIISRDNLTLGKDILSPLYGIERNNFDDSIVLQGFESNLIIRNYKKTSQSETAETIHSISTDAKQNNFFTRIANAIGSNYTLNGVKILTDGKITAEDMIIYDNKSDKTKCAYMLIKPTIIYSKSTKSAIIKSAKVMQLDKNENPSEYYKDCSMIFTNGKLQAAKNKGQITILSNKGLGIYKLNNGIKNPAFYNRYIKLD